MQRVLKIGNSRYVPEVEELDIRGCVEAKISAFIGKIKISTFCIDKKTVL